MKKIIYGLLICTLAVISMGCVKEDMNQPVEEEVIEDVNEQVDKGEEVSELVPYDLMQNMYVIEDTNTIIRYLVMSGFRGELLQDYMNQSLASVIGIYGDSEAYSNVDISYEVTHMDDEILSVVFRGTASFSGIKEINILKSINLDVGKSSNEINYGNLIKDDPAMRGILADKVVELGIQNEFEAEGIRLLF